MNPLLRLLLAAVACALQEAMIAEAARVAPSVVPIDCEPQRAPGAGLGSLPRNSFGASVFRLQPLPALEDEVVHYREFLASFNSSSLVGFHRAPTTSEPPNAEGTSVVAVGLINRTGDVVAPLTVGGARLLREQDTESKPLQEETARELNVFLPDTRVEVNENTYPYRTVGKWRGCTGIVVTNAHCLKYKSDGTMDPSMWTTDFFAAYNNGAFLAKSKPKAIWYDKDADYAVLKLWTNLDANLGRMGVWWRGEGFFSTDRPLNMISYSGDHCTSNNNCRQKLSTGKSRGTVWIGDEVKHDLDAKRGSSGSAMWYWYDGMPVMDALNFAEDRNGGEDSLTLGRYTGNNPNYAKPAGVWKAGYDKIKNA